MRRSIPVVVILLVLAVGSAAGAAADPLPWCSEDVGSGEPGIRICRVAGRDGTPVLVLTNLDAGGNRLSPAEEGLSPVSTGPVEPPAPHAPADTPAVKVVVRSGDGTVRDDDRTVEVTSDGAGGTTVIVNIHPPEPAQPPAESRPAYAIPVAIYGGFPGAYRYPNHHPFLGYGTGTGSPSWLGGLALNAGNDYGLKTGAPCGTGLECMFPPSAKNP